jgi:membrane associated rhomboid family serine protease
MSALTRFSLFPPVIKALMIINVSVFLFQFLFIENYFVGSTPLSSYFIDFFYLHPVNDGSFYIWQLITYQFIHGGLMHIFFNLFALWMFGVELENLWGGSKFLTFYLLSGIGAGLTQLYIAPLFSIPALTIGASGAVFGILVAFGMTNPNRPIFMFPFFIPIPAKFFVIIYAGLELLMGFSSTGNIAHFAHLGGAATGFILFKFGDKWGIYRFFGKLFKKRQSYVEPDYHSKVYKMDYQQRFRESERTEPHRREQSAPDTHTTNRFVVDEEEITQGQINAILDKISATGYQNLTEKEKKILFELSQRLK